MVIPVTSGEEGCSKKKTNFNILKTLISSLIDSPSQLPVYPKSYFSHLISLHPPPLQFLNSSLGLHPFWIMSCVDLNTYLCSHLPSCYLLDLHIFSVYYFSLLRGNQRHLLTPPDKLHPFLQLSTFPLAEDDIW